MADEREDGASEVQASAEYSAEAIAVLKGLENVRRRPTAFITDGPEPEPSEPTEPRVR